MSKRRNRYTLDPSALHPLLARWLPGVPSCLLCSNPPWPGTLTCPDCPPHDDGLEAYLTSQIVKLPIVLDSLPVCTFCRHPFLLHGIPFSVCQRCVGRFWRKGGQGIMVDTPDATE